MINIKTINEKNCFQLIKKPKKLTPGTIRPGGPFDRNLKGQTSTGGDKNIIAVFFFFSTKLIAGVEKIWRKEAVPP
jgi:hypothetical protein